MDADHTLKKLFNSQLGYSYLTFCQATLPYEEMEDQDFDALCQKVAATADMHPESVSLLRQVEKITYVGAVIVSCGLLRVWELVLERNGFSGTVRVMGGGRISDGFVVSAEVKVALCSRL